ncbi:MAG: hypothetical protein HGA65_11095 [Oscillochloris sp.]|nr:hypothetical protein [Oscillochloris sp.]
MSVRSWLTDLACDWLPPMLYRSLRSSVGLAHFQLTHQARLLAPSCALAGQGTGRRAFVLATGPSLRRENLAALAGEDCFSLSNFFLHDALKAIRPRLQFFAPYHRPLVLDNYAAWLHHADQHLPPETAIVLGHTTAPIVRQYGLFPQRQIFYLFLTRRHQPRRIRLDGPILAPASVPLMALPTLLAMGYTTIYLLGCDHTGLRDYGRTVTHFYEARRDVREHALDRAAWSDIITNHERSLDVFQQYRYYRTMISRHYPQARVVNLSQDSWLDLFPFDRLERVLAAPAT